MEDLLDKLEDAGTELDDALERFMDDEDLYVKYVTAFPTEPTMAQLTAAVEAKDYDAAEKAVHALKGVAGNLGFMPLFDVSMDMLEELRAGDVPAALEAYGDVQEEYRRICGVIAG